MALIAILLAALGFVAWLLSRDPRAGILGASSLAAGCSAYLYSRKLGWGGEEAICNVGSTLNCDVVNSSAASMLGGYPIAAFGLGWFVGVVIGGFADEAARPRWFQFVGITSILQLVWCLWLGVEAARLGVACVLCLTIYAAVAINVVGGVRGARASGADPLDFLPALFGAPGGLAGGATAAALASWAVLRPATAVEVVKGAHGGGVAAVSAAWAVAPVRLDGDEPVLGNPDAPILVVEFADYGCPHCAMATKVVHDLVDASPELQVRFRTYPLTGACNPLAEDRGPERCRAAMAADCAHRQGKFWEMADLIFANQNSMADEDLRFMAAQVGLNVDEWAACMADPVSLAHVAADAAAGNDAGVTGTPAFFVKGPWGDRWVQMHNGTDGIAALVRAKREGTELPTPMDHQPL